MKTELTTRPYVFEQDYAEICEWWRAREAHGWTYIPANRLPATGFVVMDGEIKCGVVFVYLCEAGWAWVEWLTTNPNSPIRRRREVVELLLKTATEYMTIAGRHSALSSLNNENLIEIFQKYGFTAKEGGMTNVIWNAKTVN